MNWSKVNDKEEFKKKAKELGIPLEEEDNEDLEEITPLDDSTTDDPDLKKVILAVNGKIVEINKAVKSNLTKVKRDVTLESEKRETASEQNKITKFIKDHKILQTTSPYSEAILNSMAVFYQKGLPLETCLEKALKIEEIPKDKLVEFEEAKKEDKKKEEKPKEDKKEEKKVTAKSVKTDEDESDNDDEDEKLKAPTSIAEASKRAFETLEAKNGNPFKEEESE